MSFMNYLDKNFLLYPGGAARDKGLSVDVYRCRFSSVNSELCIVHNTKKRRRLAFPPLVLV